MFQNINESAIDNQNYKEDKKEKNKTDIFANVFSIKNIQIYAISLMISMVGITG